MRDNSDSAKRNAIVQLSAQALHMKAVLDLLVQGLTATAGAICRQLFARPSQRRERTSSSSNMRH